MIEKLHVSGSHYDIGFAIGQQTADKIHHSFNSYPFLDDLRAYHQTDAGQARYAQMLTVHQEHYPQYLQELQGMADGANRDFTEMFLVNMRGEYRGFISEADNIRGCSDCSILTDDLALIGHNEDGSPAFREHMYFVEVQLDGQAPFTACCYPGFLCGNAFGFNAHGICYSIDNISPTHIRIGVARQFLTRAILDATSIENAIQRITPDGRASGFSYTIGSILERRIVQVEVTPDQFNVRDITHTNFHANHILDITNASQVIATSSAERVKCAQAILDATTITGADDILKILGDQSHAEYPIFRTATAPDVTETYCTALFDLDAREMRVYTGHPVREAEKVSYFDMTIG